MKYTSTGKKYCTKNKRTIASFFRIIQIRKRNNRKQEARAMSYTFSVSESKQMRQSMTRNWITLLLVDEEQQRVGMKQRGFRFHHQHVVLEVSE